MVSLDFTLVMKLRWTENEGQYFVFSILLIMFISCTELYTDNLLIKKCATSHRRDTYFLTSSP